MPQIATLPESGRINPVSIRIVVVLPAPFGPRNPKTSPARTSKDTSETGLAVAEALGQVLGGQDDLGARGPGQDGIRAHRINVSSRLAWPVDCRASGSGPRR